MLINAEDLQARHYRLFKALKSEYSKIYEELNGTEVPKSFWESLIKNVDRENG